MNWYKKAYNEPVGYLNRYLKQGFDWGDYMHYIPDFLEEYHPSYINRMEENQRANQNNLFRDENLYTTDPDSFAEEWAEQASPEEMEEFKEWIKSKNLDASRHDAPPYEIMDYSKFIKPTWLIHFTNDPDSISTNGFTQGWEDIEGLAYTTHYQKTHESPGYNFAFDINNSRDIRAAAREEKYGKHAVLFWGSGVESTHYGDNESQVIVWGPSVNTNMIIPIRMQSNGSWGIMRAGEYDDYPMVESEDITDVISWGIDNIDMARQTMDKWKPKRKKKPQLASGKNWYKKAQYENLNQWELVKMIQKINPIYLELLDKKWGKTISPEEEIYMEQVGNKLNLLGNIKSKKIEEKKEPSRKLIEEGKPHEVLPMNFMDYHNTGGIEESAYKQYGTKEGVSWLGKPEKYPKLIKRKDYQGEEIEFRNKEEKLQYTQNDPADPTGFDHLRDEQGELIYMSDEQMEEKGVPLYETSITAFNSTGEPIGWVSNEFGADGVWVIKEYQGKGIGTDLLYEFRKQFKSERRIGQMTGSGQNMTRAYHKKLVEEALREGKEVPMETLQHYELV